MALRRWYRSTGANLPFTDLRRSHPGVAMEGYFWRITDSDSGRVLIALCGVNQSESGSWATLGLAASNGFIRGVEHRGAAASASGLGVTAGEAFVATDSAVSVFLGDDARLEFQISDTVPWPRKSVGGSSVFQLVPALNQYWHPWLLGGRASGRAVLGDQTWEFTNAQVYAEKNWGREGFPDSWWWGQAQGFDEPDACVALAGGQVTAGPLHTEVTGLVVRLPDGRVFRLGNPLVSPVRARVTDERWQLRGRGFGWTVDIDAHAPRGASHILPMPLPSQDRNIAGALEHLTGTLNVRVSRFGREVWRGRSDVAGLELGGLDRVNAELVRRGHPAEATFAAPAH